LRISVSQTLLNLKELGDCMDYPYGYLLSWGVDKYIRPCIFLYINQNLGREKPQASLLFGTSQKL
jgi:hypothetical protein